MLSARRDERGTVALEIVILAPVLMGLALFVLWTGRVGRLEVQADTAAAEAAHAASAACSPATDCIADLLSMEGLAHGILTFKDWTRALCIGGPQAPLRSAVPAPAGHWLPRMLPGGVAGLEHTTTGQVAIAGGYVALRTHLPPGARVGVTEVAVEFTCLTDGGLVPLQGLVQHKTVWASGTARLRTEHSP